MIRRPLPPPSPTHDHARRLLTAYNDLLDLAEERDPERKRTDDVARHCDSAVADLARAVYALVGESPSTYARQLAEARLAAKVP